MADAIDDFAIPLAFSVAAHAGLGCVGGDVRHEDLRFLVGRRFLLILYLIICAQLRLRWHRSGLGSGSGMEESSW